MPGKESSLLGLSQKESSDSLVSPMDGGSLPIWGAYLADMWDGRGLMVGSV